MLHAAAFDESQGLQIITMPDSFDDAAIATRFNKLAYIASTAIDIEYISRL